MRILVIEDEQRIAESIRDALLDAAYIVDVAYDGDDGWFRGESEPFDAVVLDIGLPKLDGITILKRWRGSNRDMPVIILTARDGWREKVDGIDAGADDYLVKPFRMEELVARVRALTRRAAGFTSPIISHGAVTIDTRQQVVSVHGQVVKLTPLEYRLLAFLMHHRGRVVTKSELGEHVYDQSIDRDSNALEVLVSRIRRKIGLPLIETSRGHGYMIANAP